MGSDLTENVLKFRMCVVETGRERLLLDLWSLSLARSLASQLFGPKSFLMGMKETLIREGCVCVCTRVLLFWSQLVISFPIN